MPKLIIHETDCHGCGFAYCDGKTINYAYDDETGDLHGAVRALIQLGFINPDDVVIFCQDEIYQFVDFEKAKKEMAIDD